MNIPELKKAMGIRKTDLIRRKHLRECMCVHCFSDKTLLSACQLLCDTSDKLPPKKEKWDTSERFVNGKDMWGEDYAVEDKRHCNCYNSAREEDILWFTKKLMGLDIRLWWVNGKQIKVEKFEDLNNAIIQSFGQEIEGEEK